MTHGLAHPYRMMEPEYDAIVVGSGYGASIAASRLARAGLQVCVLERGKEYLPHELPETLSEASREVQWRGQLGGVEASKANPLGLFDLRLGNDLSVLVGCGLGGTSLINANVSIEPDPSIFDDPVWPEALRADADGLRAGFERAAEMLRPVPYPEGENGHAALTKTGTLRKSQERIGGAFSLPRLNVNFDVEGENHVGARQRPCNGCGNCCSGCRHRAKNTTAVTYLPDARNHGAHIFTQIEVRHLACREGTYFVYYRHHPGHPVPEDAPLSFVRARCVILGAGSLGSTEILLRSKDHGLPVSERLGHRFSGNGDVLGFAYNCDEPVHSVGWQSSRDAAAGPVGPTITGLVDLREGASPSDGVIVEEGAVPGALCPILPGSLALSASLGGEDTDAGLWDATQERLRELASFVGGCSTGAVRNTQVYLAMSHDDAGGRLVLEEDRIQVRWPGYASQPGFPRIDDLLYRATEALGGTYIANPMSREWFEGKLSARRITVHPLGGCAMGEDPRSGVVDDRCRVFDPSAASPSATHPGLYVCDAAVIPRSLGVNPLFSICAVVERACALLVDELRGRPLTYRFPTEPGFAPPAHDVADQGPLGFSFTETLEGYAIRTEDAQLDYEQAYRAGRDAGADHSLFMRVTITIDDLRFFVEDPAHLGSLTGTISCPLLSTEPLSVSQGSFNLFVIDPNDPDTRNMFYKMVVTTSDGRDYFFDGHKVIHDDPGPDIWSDTTTLFVDVREGRHESGRLLARGITRISVKALAEQIATYTALRARSFDDHLRAKALFMKHSLGSMWQVYGL